MRSQRTEKEFKDSSKRQGTQCRRSDYLCSWKSSSCPKVEAEGQKRWSVRRPAEGVHYLITEGDTESKLFDNVQSGD